MPRIGWPRGRAPPARGPPGVQGGGPSLLWRPPGFQRPSPEGQALPAQGPPGGPRGWPSPARGPSGLAVWVGVGPPSLGTISAARCSGPASAKGAAPPARGPPGGPGGWAPPARGPPGRGGLGMCGWVPPLAGCHRWPEWAAQGWPRLLGVPWPLALTCPPLTAGLASPDRWLRVPLTAGWWASGLALAWLPMGSVGLAVALGWWVLPLSPCPLFPSVGAVGLWSVLFSVSLVGFPSCPPGCSLAPVFPCRSLLGFPFALPWCGAPPGAGCVCWCWVWVRLGVCWGLALGSFSVVSRLSPFFFWRRSPVWLGCSVACGRVASAFSVGLGLGLGLTACGVWWCGGVWVLVCLVVGACGVACGLSSVLPPLFFRSFSCCSGSPQGFGLRPWPSGECTLAALAALPLSWFFWRLCDDVVVPRAFGAVCLWSRGAFSRGCGACRCRVG